MTNTHPITKVLVVNSSLNGDAGNSNKATAKYLEALKTHQHIDVTEIDLNAIDLPHLSSQEMEAWSVKEIDRTAQQSKLAAFSDDFIKALSNADEIVIGVPMYNFGIPSTLKAFFDRIARAGITFAYTENGPKGLITGKKVSVIAARGGKYHGTALDTSSAYVKNFLAFLGMTDVNFYYIEGLAMGGDSADQAWGKFSEKLSELNAA
ncbi:FMN-dependent NADH-azoreductase [Ningiella sp. W23]|uniref:FMN-dependent NADH-azoreductase n=1 Tax=Ningiella sp. W23 TaxID=3023715 RepID=UPI003757FD75